MSNALLQSLQNKLVDVNIDAYILPLTDPHQSEYIAAHWKTIAWLSKFTGSAATVVVTKNHAGLWTDSRYFIQAEQELASPFVLHKLVTREPEYLDWILDELEEGSRIGIDTQLFSTAAIEQYTKLFAKKKIQLELFDDFCDTLWADRPPLPSASIFVHDITYAGHSVEQKISDLKNKLELAKNQVFISTALDDIAWLLNIRGNDIKYVPVVNAYAVIAPDKTHLFIDKEKINNETSNHFQKNNISVHSYDAIFEFLENLSDNTTVLLDKTQVNYRLFNSINRGASIKNTSNPLPLLKSTKSPEETENIKQAYKRDGIAMCNLLQWIETHVTDENLTELDIAKKAEQFRRAQPNFIGLSFGTISAYGENAALPHYSATEESNKRVLTKGLYLVDSGGQYLDGTTDITRTIAVGEVSDEQKENYTRVLKGHIRLSRAKFPYGTRGFQLDPLARMDLWEAGLDYGHGTGHGVGYCLSVHEGPQSISNNANAASKTILEPGMLVSNEPGYYKVGEYGIRIENIIQCVKSQEGKENLLQFETLTLCPYDTSIIETSLLTKDEIDWINNYHQLVHDTLAPVSCQEVKLWIKEKTKAIPSS